MPVFWAGVQYVKAQTLFLPKIAIFCSFVTKVGHQPTPVPTFWNYIWKSLAWLALILQNKIFGTGVGCWPKVEKTVFLRLWFWKIFCLIWTRYAMKTASCLIKRDVIWSCVVNKVVWLTMADNQSIYLRMRMRMCHNVLIIHGVKFTLYHDF